MQSADSRLLKSFRDAVTAKIRRDLEEEDRQALALREVTLPILKRVIEAERTRGACGRAWLFGSFAWDKPTALSDVDVMVERCAETFRLADAIGKACGREAHIVEIEQAPATLRSRVLKEGTPL